MSANRATFAGTWKGFYSYGGPANIYDFTLELGAGSEDSITGTILEKDHTVPIEIAGFITPPVVRFYKVSVNKQSVRYFEPFEFTGFLSSDGLHVSGTWTNASAKGDWSAEISAVPSTTNGQDDGDEAEASEVDIDAVMKAPAYEESSEPAAAAAAIADADDKGLVPIDAPVESWDPEEPGHASQGGLAGALKAKLQGHSANVHSFFAVDPLEGESDLANKVEGKNGDTGYAGLGPPIVTEDKSDDSGSFVDASSANKSAFSVDPLQGEPDIFKASVQPKTYASSAPSPVDVAKPLDAGTFIDKSEANKSPFMVDPMVGEPDLSKAPPPSQGTYAADMGTDALDYGLDPQDIANGGVVHEADSNKSAFMVDPIGSELDLLAKSGVVSQVTPPAPPDTKAPDPSVLAAPPPSAAPSAQLNSNSPLAVCPRCGAERGGFSFCMGCGHSFDLSA